MIKINQYLEFEQDGLQLSYLAGFRLLRKQLGLTQSDFSEKLGVSIHNVKSYETGRRSPGLKTMEYLSKQLNKDWI